MKEREERKQEGDMARGKEGERENIGWVTNA